MNMNTNYNGKFPHTIRMNLKRDTTLIDLKISTQNWREFCIVTEFSAANYTDNGVLLFHNYSVRNRKETANV